MKTKINKFFAIFLICFFLFTNNASAMIVYDPTNHAVNSVSAASTQGSFLERLSIKVLNALNSGIIVLAKIAAAYAEQALVKAIIGKGDGGSAIIRDFNAYLYTVPQQAALAQMNLFFNSTSRGRMSSLNYEGVSGTNYDAYLVSQAKNAILGEEFVTDIQSKIANPSTEMFANGNMSGLMSFFKCSNNPYCYTLVATNKYNNEYLKAQEIAKNENVNGFIPTKVNGRITSPASIAQNALLQIDQLGTQLSMSATNNGNAEQTPAALMQIAQGTAISTVARLTNYGIVDPIKKQLDKFPFSLAYNNSGQLGITSSIGSVNLSTGAASFNTNVRIGNACANLSAGRNSSGVITADAYGTNIKCP